MMVSVAAVSAVSLVHLRRRELSTLVVGPFAVVVLVGCGFEACNYHTINQLFANLAQEVHGMSTGGIGTVVGVGGLPALLSVVLMGHFIDRCDPIRCYGSP